MRKLMLTILVFGLPAAALAVSFFVWQGTGVLSLYVETWQLTFALIFIFALAHMVIASMSISFHRHHTHGGIELNAVVDYAMQTLLWLVTTMSRGDWVPIHKIHHKHSDTPLDPHGPVARGFWHSMLLGWVDYNRGKRNPEVVEERKKMTLSRVETFYMNNPLYGPFLFSSLMIVLFGVQLGMIFSICNIFTSPILGIGGVNTIAHWWGYRNHNTNDNSRNIGYLLPLNILISGELDHNNHHAHQKSCTFRHKWYEFDIGYVYVRIFAFFRLARVKFAFTPMAMKRELSLRWRRTLEKHEHLMQRCQQLASEFELTRKQLVQDITDNIEGKKSRLEEPFIQFKKEVLRAMKQQYQFDS